MTKRPINRKKRLLIAVLAVICCVRFSVPLLAQTFDEDVLRDVRERGMATGVRTANCLIEVGGVEYLHGFCTFIPSDSKDGSFTLAATINKHLLRARVALTAPASKDGVVFWNGPVGGRAPLIELGQAHSEGACWRVGDTKGKDETRLCATSTLAVNQPTPKEPPSDTKDFIYYGMRSGMYDAIESRSGIDTDHARIITKKSRDAAIILCRGYDHDFTAECIAQTLLDVATPVLTANCQAGTFANPLGPWDCEHRDHCEPAQDLNFLGRNTHGGDGPDFLIQYRDGRVMDGSWASTYDFALNAFKLLCPETLEKAGPAKR